MGQPMRGVTVGVILHRRMRKIAVFIAYHFSMILCHHLGDGRDDTMAGRHVNKLSIKNQQVVIIVLWECTKQLPSEKWTRNCIQIAVLVSDAHQQKKAGVREDVWGEKDAFWVCWRLQNHTRQMMYGSLCLPKWKYQILMSTQHKWSLCRYITVSFMKTFKAAKRENYGKCKTLVS